MHKVRKPATPSRLPTKEVNVAKPPNVIDITPEPQFSFLSLAQAAAADIPTKGTGRTGDKVKDAKTAILAMLPKQKGYLDNHVEGREQPKTEAKPLKGASNGQMAGGKKTVSTWFTPTEDGYWTNIRWGQRSLKLGENKAWFFSDGPALHAFYDAVEAAIRAGELDKVIEAEANKKPPAQPQLVQEAAE